MQGVGLGGAETLRLSPLRVSYTGLAFQFLKQRQPFDGLRGIRTYIMRSRYLALIATVLKVVLSAVPTAVTAVMITTAMRAAIRPYSMPE